MLRVLILGSGGREHAMAVNLSSSPLCEELWVSPGNAGTRHWAAGDCPDWRDFGAWSQWVRDQRVNLLVIGPEDPLVHGLVDRCKADPSLADLAILGPDQAGARLEGSKDFSKSFMNRYGIPTAMARTFESCERSEAEAYLDTVPFPLVLKADGLAAGKGVVICSSREEAMEALDMYWVQNRFGNSGSKVLFEQFLDGMECSVFVLCDGSQSVILPVAKDYKRVGEGDNGPNTGGMGAVSPPPFADTIFRQRVEERIVRPTLEGLKHEGIEYRGFLFVGLMKVGDEPFVIEYNVRMGDPESQVVFPRLGPDMLEWMHGAARGRMPQGSPSVDSRYAVTTVICSAGYPSGLKTGFKMHWPVGLGDDRFCFHAGTTWQHDQVVNSGGRVMAVTALHEELNQAVQMSRNLASSVVFEGAFYRSDIGDDLLL
jgi:phosphoribosylamine--glycine ligase